MDEHVNQVFITNSPDGSEFETEGSTFQISAGALVVRVGEGGDGVTKLTAEQTRALRDWLSLHINDA